jgi:hypothetical protein
VRALSHVPLVRVRVTNPNPHLNPNPHPYPNPNPNPNPNQPTASAEAPLRVLLFDSWYDDFRGVLCLVQVLDGTLGVDSNTNPNPNPNEALPQPSAGARRHAGRGL